MTAGWGETEVLMDVSSRRQALVQHRNLLARGLLSLVSFLRAFLLHVIKRNQATAPQQRLPLPPPTPLPLPPLLMAPLTALAVRLFVFRLLLPPLTKDTP